MTDVSQVRKKKTTPLASLLHFLTLFSLPDIDKEMKAARFEVETYVNRVKETAVSSAAIVASDKKAGKKDEKKE